MQAGEGAAVGHLAEGQQAVRGQGGGAGGGALVDVRIQCAVVVHGGAQQEGAVRVGGQRAEGLLGASRRLARVRQVTTAVGS